MDFYRSCFPAMVLFKYFVDFFDFFCFCFMSEKYYLSKLMLLCFRCQKISFLCKQSFFMDEKHKQWNLDTKVLPASVSWALYGNSFSILDDFPKYVYVGEDRRSTPDETAIAVHAVKKMMVHEGYTKKTRQRRRRCL